VNNRSVYVGNLSYEIDSQELAQFFEKAGRVVCAKVVYSEHDKRSKGFGFVEFTTPEDAENAIRMFHDSFLKGRRMRVSFAFKKSDKEQKT
jgi:nucleolin